MSELSIFLFFLIFLIFPLFFYNKALTSDFQRVFLFCSLQSTQGSREPFRYGRAVFTFFWGPSRMFLVELVVDDG